MGEINTESTRRHRSQAEAERLVRDFEQSGLSRKAFCTSPVGVQTHDKRGRNHQACMWQYGSPGVKAWCSTSEWAATARGRSSSWANFNGLFQTDGYKGYNHVGGPKMVHACCLAHARRKYVDAVKISANDQESARIVALMDELFAIELMPQSPAHSAR